MIVVYIRILIFKLLKPFNEKNVLSIILLILFPFFVHWAVCKGGTLLWNWCFQSIYSGHFKIDAALKKSNQSPFTAKGQKHLFILKSDQISL
jgi:hypothetical protein